MCQRLCKISALKGPPSADDFLSEPGIEHRHHQVEHQELHRAFVQLDQALIHLDIKAIRLQQTIDGGQLFAAVFAVTQGLLQGDQEGVESGVVDQLGIRTLLDQFLISLSLPRRLAIISGVWLKRLRKSMPY